jgi:phosphotransferase system enzyme I (PtsP)
MLPFLLGIGLKKFSIDSVNAPTVQRLINNYTLADAQEIANTMLDFGRISQIEAYLKELKLLS